MTEHKTNFQPARTVTLPVPILNTDFAPPLPAIPWTATFLVDEENEHAVSIVDFQWIPGLKVWVSLEQRHFKNHFARACTRYRIEIRQISDNELILDAIVLSQFILSDLQNSDSVRDAFERAKKIFPNFVRPHLSRKLIKELALNTERVAQLKQDAIAVQQHPLFVRYRSFV